MSTTKHNPCSCAVVQAERILLETDCENNWGCEIWSETRRNPEESGELAKCIWPFAFGAKRILITKIITK